MQAAYLERHRACRDMGEVETGGGSSGGGVQLEGMCEATEGLQIKKINK